MLLTWIGLCHSYRMRVGNCLEKEDAPGLEISGNDNLELGLEMHLREKVIRTMSIGLA